VATYSCQKCSVYVVRWLTYPRLSNARRSRIGYGVEARKCRTTDATGKPTPSRPSKTPVRSASGVEDEQAVRDASTIRGRSFLRKSGSDRDCVFQATNWINSSAVNQPRARAGLATFMMNSRSPA
jgi:hypothetical protein